MLLKFLKTDPYCIFEGKKRGYLTKEVKKFSDRINWIYMVFAQAEEV